MTDAVTAEKQLLASEVEVVGHGVLILRKPVLIEAGSRYWVDMHSGSLVVEAPDGERRKFPGDYETRCN